MKKTKKIHNTNRLIDIDVFYVEHKYNLFMGRPKNGGKFTVSDNNDFGDPISKIEKMLNISLK